MVRRSENFDLFFGRGASFFGNFDRPPPSEIIAREGIFGFHQIENRSLGEDVPAEIPGSWADVYDLVGGEHGFEVVFDDDDGIAEAAQVEKRLDEFMVIGRMQSDGGFVEDVDSSDEAGADLRGEPDSLGFASAQRGRGAIQSQILHPDADEKFEPFANFLDQLLSDQSVEFGQAEGFEIFERLFER